MTCARAHVVVVLLALTPTLAGRALAADGAAWRGDVPCGRLLAAPRAVTKPGCAAAACIASGDDEICTCKDPTSGDVRLAVTRRGREVAAWPVEPMLGEASAFRVTRADLDGDAHDEILVAVLDVVSNGMAVQSWTTCVLDGRDPSRPRACVATDDVPFLSLPTRAPHAAKNARACRLLAARWRWGSEPRRGDGLYLVGRWLAHRDGVLAPDARRPVVARRYLYRFAAERADAVENARSAPIAWWQDGTTRTLRCPVDPLCNGAEGDQP